MFKANRTVDTSLGLALEAGFQVMGNIGGKMCVFQSGLPTVGKGPLRPRANPSALGTAAENKLLAPVSDLYYKTEAIKYSRQQICVEMFVACSGYADVATLGCLPKFTGGNMHYYPNFHHLRDGDRLAADLRRALTRDTAWESVARVRVSAGCRISAFYGNYFIRGADLLALPNCSSDWTVGINIVHSDAVLQTDRVCVQSALLYTTSRGERRIRVNTIALPVTDSEQDVYKSACLPALCNMMAKGAADVGLTNGLAAARQRLTRQCTDMVRGWSQASQGYGGEWATTAQQQQAALSVVFGGNSWLRLRCGCGRVVVRCLCPELPHLTPIPPFYSRLFPSTSTPPNRTLWMHTQARKPPPNPTRLSTFPPTCSCSRSTPWR